VGSGVVKISAPAVLVTPEWNSRQRLIVSTSDNLLKFNATCAIPLFIGCGPAQDHPVAALVNLFTFRFISEPAFVNPRFLAGS